MANYSSVMISSFLLLLQISPLATIHANSHHPPPIDAIYQFGDSISDTGNLIRDNPTGEHSNFAKLPYGETFFHKPTGRCSDGRLMIDFFAPYLCSFLGLGLIFNLFALILQNAKPNSQRRLF